MEPDLRLLDRWCAGDQVAGQSLFTRHFTEIHRFFLHKAGNDADELTQQTFLECTLSRDRFRRQSSFRTFLFAIARHELYRHLRRLRRDDHLDFEITSIAEVVTSAGSRMDRMQRVQQLRSALSELPAEQQLILELHYWHDLDAGALAEVFDAATGTIRVRLLRARRALRERLGPSAAGDAVAGTPDRLEASLSLPEDGD